MIPISKNRLKVLSSLQARKHRETHDLFVVEGIRSVQAALDARASLTELVVSVSYAAEHTMPNVDVPIWVAADADFGRISDTEHGQGILAVAPIRRTSASELAACRRILFLDGVQDPGNVGTLIRTAAWFGIDAVVRNSKTADFFQPKVVRSTMGGIWDVHLAEVVDPVGFLTHYQSIGFRVYAADLKGIPFPDFQPQTPSILLAGSEANGISRNLYPHVDESVYIESAGKKGVESLNVGVATGLIMQKWQMSR